MNRFPPLPPTRQDPGPYATCVSHHPSHLPRPPPPPDPFSPSSPNTNSPSIIQSSPTHDRFPEIPSKRTFNANLRQDEKSSNDAECPRLRYTPSNSHSVLHTHQHRRRRLRLSRPPSSPSVLPISPFPLPPHSSSLIFVTPFLGCLRSSSAALPSHHHSPLTTHQASPSKVADLFLPIYFLSPLPSHPIPSSHYSPFVGGLISAGNPSLCHLSLLSFLSPSSGRDETAMFLRCTTTALKTCPFLP